MRSGSHALRSQLSEDTLLARRTVLLRGPIFDREARDTIAKLLYLAHDDAAPVSLYIDSIDGEVSTGLAIRDTIDELGVSVFTHCLDHACGVALVVIAHGRRGRRSATRDALLGLTSTYDAHTDAIIAEMVAHDTGQSVDVVLRDMRAERSFGVEEAKLYGLIDVIED